MTSAAAARSPVSPLDIPRAGGPFVGGSRILSALTLLLLLAATGLAADPAMAAEQKQKAIDAIAPRLQNTMGRAKWQKLLRRWQPKLNAAGTAQEFYAVLNRMLRSDGKSHSMIVSPELQQSRGKRKQDLRGRVGITASLVERRAVITFIEPDSPAAAAGLKPGYAITAVGKWQARGLLERLETSNLPPNKQRDFVTSSLRYQLAGPIGSEFDLTGLDGDNRPQTFRLKREAPAGKVVQYGTLPPWRMAFESRPLAGGKVGYIRFNIFLMPLLKRIKKAVKAFHDCDGIIIDLRGNPGGFGMMAIPVANLFYGERTSLGESKMTESNIRYTILPNRKPYTGKVLLLTDGGTASTSEVLAGGMQENGRAEVVGQQTMGAVLPSLIVKLPNGAQLQYPIGDFKTPKGKSLEGVGVTPDHPVKLTRKALLNLGDPVLDKALKLITADTEKGTPTP